jgi:plastocyanin
MEDSMTKSMRCLLATLALVAVSLLLSACGADAPETRPAAVDRPAEPVAPAGTAAVTGTIWYEGEVPTLRPLNLDADPICAAKHDEPLMPEILVLGEGNTLANVFAKIANGLPDREWPVPAEPVVMDQVGCMYVPRVHGIMVGQTFRILNSDGILHNVNAAPNVNRRFNIGMPAARTEAEHVFTDAEEMFTIRCDVHPWMAAYVSVLAHPFFSVTGKDGQFEISRLPEGTYEVEVWHERLGTLSETVTLADGETKSVEFTYSR